MTSTYSVAETFAELEPKIQELWDTDFRLVDVEYIDEQWVGVFNEATNANAYVTSGNFTEFSQKITAKWDEGLDLIDIEYADGSWVGVFEGISILGGTAYSFAEDFTQLEVEIQERWDEFDNLTNIEYANGSWVAIFDSNALRNGYWSSDSFTGLETTIQERWDEGFDLIGVEYAEGTWVGVFEDSPYISSAYTISSDRQEFLKEFRQYRADGYSLVDFEQGEDILFGVYEKRTVSEAEELQDDILAGQIATDLIVNSISI